jgi:hypothetical protein
VSRVRVTIDEIALMGFEPNERGPLIEALRAEFAAAFSDPAARAEWMSSRTMPVLRIPGMPFQGGPGAARKLGATTVRAIGRELQR